MGNLHAIRTTLNMYYKTCTLYYTIILYRETNYIFRTAVYTGAVAQSLEAHCHPAWLGTTMLTGVLCLFQGVGMLRGAGALFGMLEVSLYDLCDKVGNVTAKYRKAAVDSELSTQGARVASMDFH